MKGNRPEVTVHLPKRTLTLHALAAALLHYTLLHVLLCSPEGEALWCDLTTYPMQLLDFGVLTPKINLNDKISHTQPEIR